jgi:outer membrane protein assembly factor BamA
MAALGGSTSMRGYYDGRYRDRSQVVFQAEYRFPLIGRLGGAAFLSYGDVSPRLSQFDLLRFKYSYGTGLRFRVNPRERLNLRIDYGWGKGKSQGLYFTLGEAF